ncbi:beta-microseminoprotein-like [Mantella aurantiaca]
MHYNCNSRSSAMRPVVCFILASGFLMMLCNATCSGSGPRRLSRGQKLTGCMDGDIMREFNSKWFIKDCMECSCLPDGSIDCCTEIIKPVPSDPECEAVLNQTTCNYVIKRKDNSAKPCFIRGVM